MSGTFYCKNCKSRDLDFVPESGQYVATYFVCTECGLVNDVEAIITVMNDQDVWDEGSQWDVLKRKRYSYVGKKYFVAKLEKVIKGKVRKDSMVIDGLAFIYQRSLETFHRILPKRRKFIDIRCFVWFASGYLDELFDLSKEEFDILKNKLGLPSQVNTVHKNLALWKELEPYLDFRISNRAINISRT